MTRFLSLNPLRAWRARSRLFHAVNTFSVGFSLYDEQERFVVCNRTFRQWYSTISEFLVPGRTMEEIMFLRARSGLAPEAEGREDEWVAERMEVLRAGDGSYDVLTQSGTWLQTRVRRTRQGYTLVTVVDVTEEREREERLQRLVNDIGNAAQKVKALMARIESGMSNLAARSAEQVSALESTSASLDELRSTAQQNSLDSRNADTLATKAREAATQGGNVAGEAVSAMQAIESSTAEIRSVASLIREVAEQTNVLALNASIEASRAGSHGNGFTVIAHEVRALASRTAEASNHISEMVGNSIQHVAHSTDSVTSTSSSLSEIASDANTVAEHMSAIVSASLEQATSIDAVSAALRSVEETTQRNAALAKEASEATRTTLHQITHLHEVANRQREAS